MEAGFQKALSGTRSWAERHFAMMMGTLLKYDYRTKEGKKAYARIRLSLVTATDQDLQELAELSQIGLQALIETREEIKARGIPKEHIAGRR